jgi:hypothetical protein
MIWPAAKRRCLTIPAEAGPRQRRLCQTRPVQNAAQEKTLEQSEVNVFVKMEAEFQALAKRLALGDRAMKRALRLVQFPTVIALEHTARSMLWFSRNARRIAGCAILEKRIQSQLYQEQH